MPTPVPTLMSNSCDGRPRAVAVAVAWVLAGSALATAAALDLGLTSAAKSSEEQAPQSYAPPRGIRHRFDDNTAACSGAVGSGAFGNRTGLGKGCHELHPGNIEDGESSRDRSASVKEHTK